MMNLSAISTAIADHLAPLFPALNVYAEVDETREEEVGRIPDLVIRSGAFSEILPPNYTYKARFEVILLYQPEAAAGIDPDALVTSISSALHDFIASWTGNTLPTVPAYLYEGKLLPTVPKKSPLQYEYHIPLTLFLQF